MSTRLKKAMKAGLCALVLAGASLAIGLDAGPAHAVTTSVVIALAAPDPVIPGQTVCLSPPTPAATAVGIVGGPPIDLCVWAKDVTDPAGLGAYNVGFTYNSGLVTVQSLTPQTTWLGSTGRAVFCSPGEINPNPPSGLPFAEGSCYTINEPPPYGPQGTGLIGKVTVQPNATPGLTTLTFPSLTFLVSVVPASSGQNIVANVSGMNIRIARCADFNGDNTVRVPDILYIVRKYGTNDGPADLDENGIILVPDIVIAVLQYGRDCPT